MRKSTGYEGKDAPKKVVRRDDRLRRQVQQARKEVARGKLKADSGDVTKNTRAARKPAGKVMSAKAGVGVNASIKTPTRKPKTVGGLASNAVRNVRDIVTGAPASAVALAKAAGEEAANAVSGLAARPGRPEPKKLPGVRPIKEGIQRDDPLYALGEAAVKKVKGDDRGARRALQRAGDNAYERPVDAAAYAAGGAGAAGRGATVVKHRGKGGTAAARARPPKRVGGEGKSSPEQVKRQREAARAEVRVKQGAASEQDKQTAAKITREPALRKEQRYSANAATRSVQKARENRKAKKGLDPFQASPRQAKRIRKRRADENSRNVHAGGLSRETKAAEQAHKQRKRLKTAEKHAAAQLLANQRVREGREVADLEALRKTARSREGGQRNAELLDKITPEHLADPDVRRVAGEMREGLRESEARLKREGYFEGRDGEGTNPDFVAALQPRLARGEIVQRAKGDKPPEGGRKDPPSPRGSAPDGRTQAGKVEAAKDAPEPKLARPDAEQELRRASVRTLRRKIREVDAKIAAIPMQTRQAPVYRPKATETPEQAAKRAIEGDFAESGNRSGKTSGQAPDKTRVDVKGEAQGQQRRKVRRNVPSDADRPKLVALRKERAELQAKLERTVIAGRAHAAKRDVQPSRPADAPPVTVRGSESMQAMWRSWRENRMDFKPGMKARQIKELRGHPEWEPDDGLWGRGVLFKEGGIHTDYEYSLTHQEVAKEALGDIELEGDREAGRVNFTISPEGMIGRRSLTDEQIARVLAADPRLKPPPGYKPPSAVDVAGGGVELGAGARAAGGRGVAVLGRPDAGERQNGERGNDRQQDAVADDPVAQAAHRGAGSQPRRRSRKRTGVRVEADGYYWATGPKAGQRVVEADLTGEQGAFIRGLEHESRSTTDLRQPRAGRGYSAEDAILGDLADDRVLATRLDRERQITLIRLARAVEQDFAYKTARGQSRFTHERAQTLAGRMDGEWSTLRVDANESVIVPREIADRWTRQISRPSRTERAGRYVTRQFIRTVLPFSMTWQAGNVADLYTRLVAADARFAVPGLAGRSGRDILDATELAMRELDPHLADELTQSLKGHFGARSTVPPLKFSQITDDAKSPLIRAAGEAISAVRDLPGVRQAADAGRATTDKAFALGTKAESAMVRRAAGVAIERYAKALGHDVRDHAQLAQKLAGEFKDDPAKLMEFQRRTLEITGDYVTRGPGLKLAQHTAVPFIQWIKAANKFVFHTLPAKHPYKTALMLWAASVTEQQRRELGLSSYITPDEARKLGLKPPQVGFLAGALPLPGGKSLPVAPLTSFGEAAGILEGISAAITDDGDDGLETLLGSRVFPFVQGPIRKGLEHGAEVGVSRAVEAFVPGTKQARRAMEGERPHPRSTVIRPKGTGGKSTADRILAGMTAPVGREYPEPKPKPGHSRNQPKIGERFSVTTTGPGGKKRTLWFTRTR